MNKPVDKNLETQILGDERPTEVSISEMLRNVDSASPPVIGNEAGPVLPEGYQFVAPIGRGGMGSVVLAKHKRLGRLVAIKTLLPDVSGDSRFAQRFHKEAQALAAIQHPNVVTIHDFGELTGGDLYLVMEYVQGETLRDALKRGTFSFEVALKMIRQICGALAGVHELGIVHRDLKPENILIDHSGVTKVADFGLATSVRRGALDLSTNMAGTLVYMAPEQKVANLAVTAATDVFALGLIFYEMLVGTVPQGAFEPASRFAGTPSALDNILRRCLQADPGSRFKTARQLDSALSHFDLYNKGRRNLILASSATAIALSLGFTAWLSLVEKVDLLSKSVERIALKGRMDEYPEGTASIRLGSGSVVTFKLDEQAMATIAALRVKCGSLSAITGFEFSLSDGVQTWTYTHPKTVPAGEWNVQIPGGNFSPPLPSAPGKFSSATLSVKSDRHDPLGLADFMEVTELALIR